MALFSNTGLPGSGKTEYLTYLAIRHYKRENNIVNRFMRKYIKKLNDKDIYVNNVYTDYWIGYNKLDNFDKDMLK